MTQCLPPNLLALFKARDPITYLPPVSQLPWEKKTDGYSGVASLVERFEHPADTPAPTKLETKEERLERKSKEKAEQIQYKLEQEIAMWDPATCEKVTSDPYKTLFIGRINYDSSESKLRREFEMYGTIKKIDLVHSISVGKPRGYAFIEYEHERDMHAAYKNADGKKIDNRRVLVDVERARTVKGWLPRRLGGGLGGTRRGGVEINSKHSGREEDRKKNDDRGSRDRDRGDRDRDRDRGDRGNADRGDRDRGDRGERPQRKRDREREPQSHRRPRSRSRDRKRRRTRSPRNNGGIEEEDRRRHRSKSRDRKRRSSRERGGSRDRKHQHQHRPRGDREREREPRPRPDVDEGLNSVKIKQEPDDDYPEFPGGQYYNNFPLKDEERPKNGAKYEEPEENDY